MKHKISLIAFGHATSLTIAISFTLCVVFDLVMPQHAMYSVWLNLLPGFEWITWKSFFLGLFESYMYGWYFTLIWVPIYNFFGSKKRSLPS
ncbi:MAG: hypothetical protein ACJAUY_000157 [Cognaticolwellia sp.]|jgi:hypothetical protein|tara:strand:+ start:1218 stop:1490 length:273 start_codon:yes stop_codon:yes gene_type:complete